MSLSCYKCEVDLNLDLNQDIPRSEECHSCYASLRCCMMCSFYDKQSYNECREPTADRIVDKEKANFCDHFKLGNPEKNAEMTSSAQSAAAALFKK